MPVKHGPSPITTAKFKTIEPAIRGRGNLKTLALTSLAVVAVSILSASPAPAAGWFIVKDEADPFDPSKSTFLAGTRNGNGPQGMAIRCLEGRISLIVATGPSNASAGEPSELKIVADALPVREEEDAVVLMATNDGTGVQFGDESTLDYLKGAQKISVRFSVAHAILTESFSGGKSLADVVTKAMKACGK